MGNFIADKMEGHGHYKWADGTAYDGEWSDNLMHGKGTFTWDNGCSYVGNFVQDKKEGYGIYRWPNGRVYEGEWKDGKQHGHGTYTNLKNERKNGIWEAGKVKKWLKSKHSH